MAETVGFSQVSMNLVECTWFVATVFFYLWKSFIFAVYFTEIWTFFRSFIEICQVFHYNQSTQQWNAVVSAFFDWFVHFSMNSPAHCHQGWIFRTLWKFLSEDSSKQSFYCARFPISLRQLPHTSPHGCHHHCHDHRNYWKLYATKCNTHYSTRPSTFFYVFAKIQSNILSAVCFVKMRSEYSMDDFLQFSLFLIASLLSFTAITHTHTRTLQMQFLSSVTHENHYICPTCSKKISCKIHKELSVRCFYNQQHTHAHTHTYRK